MKTKTEALTIGLDNAPITSAELREHARVMFQRYNHLGTDRAHLDYQLASADADRAEQYDQAFDALRTAADMLSKDARAEHSARMRHADHGTEQTYTAVHCAAEKTAESRLILHNRALELAQAAGRDSRYDSMHPLHRYPDAWRSAARRSRTANEDRINARNVRDAESIVRRAGLDSTPSHLAAIQDAESQPDRTCERCKTTAADANILTIFEHTLCRACRQNHSDQ